MSMACHTRLYSESIALIEQARTARRAITISNRIVRYLVLMS
jgi:hypothetical protein